MFLGHLITRPFLKTDPSGNNFVLHEFRLGAFWAKHYFRWKSLTIFKKFKFLLEIKYIMSWKL